MKTSKKKVIKKKVASKPAKTAKKKSSLRGYKAVQGEVVDSKSSAGSTSEAAKKTTPADSFSEDLVADTLPVLVEKADSSTTSIAATDPVARYLMEIRKYPLLTREQEQALALKYKETGDPMAAERLVTANLRFVVKVASEYSKFGARMIDLIQEGNVGLMHAVREFNPYKGVRLITYAVWWIRGYIREYLMKQYSMVRIGTTANQKKLFYQLQKEKDNLEKMGFDHGIALLSGKLGVSEEEITNMQSRLSQRDVSLDQPLSEDGDVRLLDVQSEVDPNRVDDELSRLEEIENLRELIDNLRPELSEREIELLEDRLLADDPLTLQEIGERHKISREAVRQMEVRLMDKIKSRLLSGQTSE